MKRFLTYSVIILAMLTGLVGCGRGGRVIPRAKMAQIYADMFVADQWMRDHPQYRKEADTCLFFEAIFREYGYTRKDYDATVAEYVKDPIKFQKIFAKAVDLMEQRRDQVRDLPDSLQPRVEDNVEELNIKER